MQKLGRYDLVRVLGKGSMGLVYEGRDPNLDRRVAIKTIRVENLTAEEAADYEIRFRTEARSVARLHHPNVVTVFDSDRDADVAFLVMEFVEGDDLKQHLDRGEVYNLGQTVGIMSDLLAAMDYAHRQGVVHRDIKPANLLIEPSGRLKLTDFGVARIQDSADATRTQGSMVGTLKYMSPEQVQGWPIDGRSDLFAAGVVLYQLLTNKRPFDGASDFDVIKNIVGETPLPPSHFTPGLPPALDAVVLKSLEKSRDQRFASAHEFHEALVGAIQSETDQNIAPEAKTVAIRRLGPVAPMGEASSGSQVTQEAELVYWKDIKDSSDVEDFYSFLRRFPSGIYADLAKRQLKRLKIGSDGSSASSTSTLRVPRPPNPAGNDDVTVVSPVTEALAAPAAPPAPIASEVVGDKEETSPAHAPKKRTAWIAAAVAAVAVLAVVAFGVDRETATESAKAPEAALPIEEVMPSTASAPAPTASVATTPASAPVQPRATAAVATKAPVAGAAPVKSEVASDAAAVKATAAKPKAVTAGSKAVESPNAPKSADATAPADPRVPCEGRWFLSYQVCMSKECAKPSTAQHPVCVERRAQERTNLERAQTGN